MATAKNRLTDKFIQNLDISQRKKYADSGGLYIMVTNSGSKLWQMSYRFNGKQKVLSFGAFPDVSILEARRKREEAKLMLANNQDPGANKKSYKRALDVDAQIIVLESMRTVRDNILQELIKIQKAKDLFEKAIKDLDKQMKAIEQYIVDVKGH